MLLFTHVHLAFREHLPPSSEDDGFHFPSLPVSQSFCPVWIPVSIPTPALPVCLSVSLSSPAIAEGCQLVHHCSTIVVTNYHAGWPTCEGHEALARVGSNCYSEVLTALLTAGRLAFELCGMPPLCALEAAESLGFCLLGTVTELNTHILL